MKIVDLAFQRSKYKHLSDDEWRWFLQQVEGRERTADKLPTFASIPDWWYPVRLSCEQCSSELAAKYKRELIVESLEFREVGKLKVASRFADLTGGYGVDTCFLSEVFEHTDYIEQNEELCRIAEHNFADKPITIHNTSAEEFLKQIVNRTSSNRKSEYDLIFLDPARRDSHGGKVFRLEDCTPNVVELLPTLLQHSKQILLKLSPMLDLTQAVTSLSQVIWDIYVVAIKNEVKEVLLLSGGTGQITAIDLDKKDQAFVFTREEESNGVAVQQCNGLTSISDSGLYLYEPNAAILKAGAYKLVGERFGLHKLDVNTHLYCSDELVPDFPGRVWKIDQMRNGKINEKMVNGQMVNIICRNYPLTPEQLKKKLHLKDGGTAYVIGCRVAGKPVLLYGNRLS